MTFEKELKAAIEKKILKEVATHDFTKLGYDARHELPKDIVSKIWADVDWTAVMAQIKPEMERRVCNAIVGNMEKEIKTDVKAILSIDGVRQRLRVEVYPEIMRIVGEEK